MKRAATLAFRQSGMSLVEFLVGSTVGLMVAGGASFMAINQAGAHRRLAVETQLQQDLRAVSELIHHDMQRAGFRGLAGYSMWAPPASADTAASPALPNQFATITVSNPGSANAAMLYQYHAPKDGNPAGPPSGLASNQMYGLKLAEGVIYLQVGDKNWQPLTDPAAVEITEFRITPQLSSASLDEFCDKPCNQADGCVRQTVRRYDFVITAKAKALKSLSRTLAFSERVPSDDFTGACPS